MSHLHIMSVNKLHNTSRNDITLDAEPLQSPHLILLATSVDHGRLFVAVVIFPLLALHPGCRVGLLRPQPGLRETGLLLLRLPSSEQHVVLEHEDDVEEDGQGTQTKLCWVSKNGLPVICMGHNILPFNLARCPYFRGKPYARTVLGEGILERCPLFKHIGFTLYSTTRQSCD